MAKTKIQKYCFYAVIGIIVYMILYYLTRYLIKRGTIVEKGFWLRIQQNFWIIFLIMLGIVGTVYIVDYLIRRKNYESPELPKQPVDTVDVERIWKQEFCKGTNIHCKYTYDNNGKEIVIPLKDNAVIVKNTRFYSWPTTGDEFWEFEAHVRDGQYKGSILKVTIPIDRGKEFIKNNWQSFILEHKFDELKLSRDKPLATPQSASDRIEVKKFELLEEGYTPRELKHLEGFKPKPEITTTKKPNDEMTAKEYEEYRKRVLENIGKAQDIAQKDGGTINYGGY